MSLSSAYLANQFNANIANGLDEASAIGDWSESYSKYIDQAGAILTPTFGGAPQTAMESAMVGLSTPGQGALKIVSGINALWASMASTPAVYFPSATLITPPPGLSTLQATLEATFITNTSTPKDRAGSLIAIATDIHNASQGGTYTNPTSTYTIT